MITFEEISKTYSIIQGQVVHALKEVTLHIMPGEFVAIRGASGSGKSTLLNILGCLDQPTSGIYRFEGEDVSRYDDRRLSRIRNARIGFIFQSFNLLARTTALENVEVPMVYRDGHVDRAKAISILERVGLSGRANHFTTQLSGGEQQRVALARALINDPALVLADEPTGNLDANAANEVIRLLQELHREGRTIVLVTHDDQVASFASRVIFLKGGQISSENGGAKLARDWNYGGTL